MTGHRVSTLGTDFRKIL